MMLERLAAARDLMSDDGAIFVEIDDTELARSQCAMDDVFRPRAAHLDDHDRAQRGDGHKAGNRGPVNVTDYLFVYARDRARFRYNPVVRERTRYDAAYSTWLENRAIPVSGWTFLPLRGPRAQGHAPAAPTLAEVHAFAIEHTPGRSCRLRAAALRGAVSRGGAGPHRPFRAANRTGCCGRAQRPQGPLASVAATHLRLADKRCRDRRPARPRRALTNVWDDIGFQRNRARGWRAFWSGARSRRSSSARILAMSTTRGDWVLDAFLGERHHGRGRAQDGANDGWDRARRARDALCIPRLRSGRRRRGRGGVTRAFAWRGGRGLSVWA